MSLLLNFGWNRTPATDLLPESQVKIFLEMLLSNMGAISLKFVGTVLAEVRIFEDADRGLLCKVPHTSWK